MLKLDHFRIDDNFFELGGHSLLAAQIVTKLRLALAKQIPVRILFEAPTIAQLAKAHSCRYPLPSIPVVPVAGSHRLLRLEACDLCPDTVG